MQKHAALKLEAEQHTRGALLARIQSAATQAQASTDGLDTIDWPAETACPGRVQLITYMQRFAPALGMKWVGPTIHNSGRVRYPISPYPDK